MEMVFVYEEGLGVVEVQSYDGKSEEEWASVWGVRNYPTAIYFVAKVEMV